MPMELRWIVSTSASAMHAAAALLAGQRLTDERLADALAEETQRLGEFLTSHGIATSAFFEHVIPLSVRLDQPRALAEVLLTKLLGRDATSDAAALVGHLLALDDAFAQALPQALVELELRAEPLGQQWEARGPGLLAELARLTGPGLLVAEAEVILVQPVLGGAGAAHWLYNSVHIEAMLANPVPELPEVLRLGWLLARLNLDLPMFEGDLRRDRLREVGALAMMPAVLTAAEEVEWARLSESSLAAALAAWHLDAADPLVLLRWWETYLASRPPWDVALSALDRMLGEPGGAEPPDADV